MDRPLVRAVLVLLPVLLTLAWVPLRQQLPNVDVALVLVLAVTASGATGRRSLVVAAAVGAAAGFAFFDTRPYERFVISRQPDLETLIVLALVGLVTGELAVRARLRSGGPGRDDVDRVREIAALVASGAELVTVLGAVGDELTRTLGGSGCTYEAGDSAPGALVIGRDGVLGRVRTPAGPERRRPGGPASTPGGASVWPDATLEVPVTGVGQVIGRFLVQHPTASALQTDRLLVALTLADQAGAALIAQAPQSADQSLPDEPPPPPRPVLRVVD